MSQTVKLKKGLNIRLKGKPEKVLAKAEAVDLYAINFDNFLHVTPKLLVQENQIVKAGTPLFCDKYNENLHFVSPVSGTVLKIERGDKRKLISIIVKSDTTTVYEDFGKANPNTLSHEQITEKLLKSGTWIYIRQRPYNIIASPSRKPKSIFISAIDTAPLAPDYDYILKDEEKNFETGIAALSKLTDGKIHINVSADFPTSSVYGKATDKVLINKIKGPHPAGNVGIQIHHIDPINKGEEVWVVNPADVAIIGRVFEKGIYDASKLVALTGSEVKTPKYFKLISGANLKNLFTANVSGLHNRYISGNVLNGTRITEDGYLGIYDYQLTVIPEGDTHEFLGWALPGFNKFSVSRTFFSWLTPQKEYSIDSNYHGGERAFVITGLYEKVLPMDILPMQLFKAILAEDIELMENLGIYEVVEEDFALCEFVCPSKIDLQSIVRKGLDTVLRETR